MTITTYYKIEIYLTKKIIIALHKLHFIIVYKRCVLFRRCLAWGFHEQAKEIERKKRYLGDQAWSCECEIDLLELPKITKFAYILNLLSLVVFHHYWKILKLSNVKGKSNESNWSACEERKKLVYLCRKIIF